MCCGNSALIASKIRWLTLYIIGDYIRTIDFSLSSYAWITNLDFSYALSVPLFLTSSTNRELKSLIPSGSSSLGISSNTPCVIRPLISFCLDCSNWSYDLLLKVISVSVAIAVGSGYIRGLPRPRGFGSGAGGMSTSIVSYGLSDTVA